MNRILCVCNTYYQLILAIQLSITIFNDGEVSVALSDASKNSSKVYENLKKCDLFRKVFYFKTKEDSRGKIQIALSYITGKDYIWETNNIGAYDEIIYFTEGKEIYSLFAYIYKYNKNIRVSRYEEGIFSYGLGVAKSKKGIIAASIRHLKFQKALEDAYYNFYCFFPRLYQGTMKPVKIPDFDTNPKLAEYLRDVFDITVSESDYSEKYIYFSSVYDFEGGEPIGELNLVKRIADTVGKENLLVKVHPRDDINKYMSYGLNIDRNSSAPWEAIQLSHDFSRNIFLTSTSGAAIGSCLFQKKSPVIFYLYNLCNVTGKNPAAMEQIRSIKDILSFEALSEKTKKVHVVDNLLEILQ